MVAGLKQQHASEEAEQLDLLMWQRLEQACTADPGLMTCVVSRVLMRR
jgi:hypothetical protein